MGPRRIHWQVPLSLNQNMKLSLHNWALNSVKCNECFSQSCIPWVAFVSSEDDQYLLRIFHVVCRLCMQNLICTLDQKELLPSLLRRA